MSRQTIPLEQESSNNLSCVEIAFKSLSYFFPCFGWSVVPYNTEQVNFYFGKYDNTQSAGMHWNPCCGLSNYHLNIGLQFFETNPIKIFDINNTQVNMCVNVKYKINDSKEFVIASNSRSNIVDFQTQAITKSVFSKHPYNAHVADEIKHALQDSLAGGGIQIIDVKITDIQMDQSLANQMQIVKSAELQSNANEIIAISACQIIERIANDVGKDMEKSELDSMKKILAVTLIGNKPTMVMSTEKFV